MDGRLEAAHVLHGHVLAVPGFQVLVQNGEDLVVDDLEPADAFHHFL